MEILVLLVSFSSVFQVFVSSGAYLKRKREDGVNDRSTAANGQLV